MRKSVYLHGTSAPWIPFSDLEKLNPTTKMTTRYCMCVGILLLCYIAYNIVIFRLYVCVTYTYTSCYTVCVCVSVCLLCILEWSVRSIYLQGCFRGVSPTSFRWDFSICFLALRLLYIPCCKSLVIYSRYMTFIQMYTFLPQKVFSLCNYCIL